MPESFKFTTSLWRRSQSSFATTIPREILAIKSAPTGQDAVVEWSINEQTGKVEVEFKTKDEG